MPIFHKLVMRLIFWREFSMFLKDLHMKCLNLAAELIFGSFSAEFGLELRNKFLISEMETSSNETGILQALSSKKSDRRTIRSIEDCMSRAVRFMHEMISFWTPFLGVFFSLSPLKNRHSMAL
jgi:hypothetical protein